MPAIFIVDDDDAIRDALEIFFKKRQYSVQAFADGRNLLENVVKYKPNLLLMDIHLRGEDGRELCHAIKATVHYPIKILLFSANPLSLLTYEHSYADGIINKPFLLNDLEEKCRRLLSLPHRR